MEEGEEVAIKLGDSLLLSLLSLLSFCFSAAAAKFV